MLQYHCSLKSGIAYSDDIKKKKPPIGIAYGDD
jgi:hypothetical protein